MPPRDVACDICGGRFFPNSLPFHRKSCAKTYMQRKVAQQTQDQYCEESFSNQLRNPTPPSRLRQPQQPSRLRQPEQVSRQDQQQVNGFPSRPSGIQQGNNVSNMQNNMQATSQPSSMPGGKQQGRMQNHMQKSHFAGNDSRNQQQPRHYPSDDVYDVGLDSGRSDMGRKRSNNTSASEYSSHSSGATSSRANPTNGSRQNPNGPNPAGNRQNPNGPNPGMKRPNAVVQKGYDVSNFEVPPNVNGPIGLEPCRYCGRTFAPERIAKHENACINVQKKRKVFDVTKKRAATDGTGEGLYVPPTMGRKRPGQRQPARPVEPPKQKLNTNWREQSKAFRQAIRAGRSMASMPQWGGGGMGGLGGMGGGMGGMADGMTGMGGGVVPRGTRGGPDPSLRRRTSLTGNTAQNKATSRINTGLGGRGGGPSKPLGGRGGEGRGGGWGRDMMGGGGGGLAGLSHSNHTSADNALASNSLMTAKHSVIRNGDGLPRSQMILRG